MRYEASVLSGQRDIPIVSQFQSLFPEADHFISYYTAEYGMPTWNSKVGIAGRYRLAMQFPLRSIHHPVLSDRLQPPHFT